MICSRFITLNYDSKHSTIVGSTHNYWSHCTGLKNIYQWLSLSVLSRKSCKAMPLAPQLMYDVFILPKLNGKI